MHVPERSESESTVDELFPDIRDKILLLFDFLRLLRFIERLNILQMFSSVISILDSTNVTSMIYNILISKAQNSVFSKWFDLNS